jgi:hypothetical protein
VPSVTACVLSKAFSDMADDSRAIAKSSTNFRSGGSGPYPGRKKIGILPADLKLLWFLWLEYRHEKRGKNEFERMVAGMKKQIVLDILQFQLEKKLIKCSRDQIAELTVDRRRRIWQKKAVR